MVRVYEDYVDVKDARGQLKANLRVIVYLEDNGARAGAKQGNSLQQARDLRAQSNGGGQQIDG